MVNRWADAQAALESLDTPALCLDLDAFEANVRRAAELCRAHDKAWRPHAKGHKSTRIARLLVEAGATGATCAKLGEAEVLAAAGVRDLLIANQLAGAQKLDRFIALCRNADPIATVDHPQQAQWLADTALRAGVRPRVVLEVDLGLSRAGVLPENALELARAIASHGSLRLVGVMGYEGHLLTVTDSQAKAVQIRAALGALAEIAQLLRRDGHETAIVSAGGTGSFTIALDCPGITELQAGGLIFMDNFYRTACQVTGFEFALTVLTTVTSRPAPRRAILDAGRKTHHIDLAPPSFVDHPALGVTQLSAEHCRLEWDDADFDLRLGDRLRFVPGYADFTCVLHDVLHVYRGAQYEGCWPLEARGKLQ